MTPDRGAPSQTWEPGWPPVFSVPAVSSPPPAPLWCVSGCGSASATVVPGACPGLIPRAPTRQPRTHPPHRGQVHAALSTSCGYNRHSLESHKLLTGEGWAGVHSKHQSPHQRLGKGGWEHRARSRVTSPQRAVATRPRSPQGACAGNSCSAVTWAPRTTPPALVQPPPPRVPGTTWAQPRW